MSKVANQCLLLVPSTVAQKAGTITRFTRIFRSKSTCSVDKLQWSDFQKHSKKRGNSWPALQPNYPWCAFQRFVFNGKEPEEEMGTEGLIDGYKCWMALKTSEKSRIYFWQTSGFFVFPFFNQRCKQQGSIIDLYISTQYAGAVKEEVLSLLHNHTHELKHV